jgi:hypothetical protein
VGDFDAKSYKWNFMRASTKCVQVEFVLVETVLVGDLELVSKELNHLAAILHVYARGLNFMK